MQEEQEVADAIAEIAPVEQPALAKKKPGRPKKKIEAVQIAVHGIVEAPTVAGNILELVYSVPSLFKKIFQLFKAFEVSEIRLNFTKEGLNITTQDHLNKSTIYTTIDGACMNLYYCRDTVEICVKRNELETIFSTLTKSQYKTTFALRENNFRSILYVTILDTEYNSAEIFEVNVVRPENVIQQYNDNDTNYPLRFSMSSKYFKTKIAAIRKRSPVITIQKTGESPMEWTYDACKNTPAWSEKFTDVAKLNMRSNIAEDDILLVSLILDYIRPFSNSNIGEDVHIAIDKQEKISFMSEIDKKDLDRHAATVKIFTEIKDYRRENKD